MKRTVLLVAILAIASGALTSAAAHAQTPTPLSAPIPPINGAGAPTTEITGVAEYIKLIYIFGIGFGMLLAVGIIVARGIQYTVSELIPSKEEALSGIKAALLGLLLLLGANVILYYINPALLDLTEPGFTGSAPATPIPLPQPTNFVITTDAGTPTFHWEYPSTSEDVHFAVERLSGASGWVFVAATTDKQLAVPAAFLKPKETHLFQVVAQNENTSKTSEPSATLTLTNPPTIETPSALTFDVGSKKLSWQYDGAPLVGFQVQVSPSTLNPPPATTWQDAPGGSVPYPTKFYAATDPFLSGGIWWMRVVPVGSDGMKEDKASAPLQTLIP